jgi:threonine dehydrogenase-like Zn-dependent dehydrogenase
MASSSASSTRTNVLLITGSNPIQFDILPDNLDYEIPQPGPTVLVRCLRTIISPWINSVIDHLNKEQVLIPSPLPLLPGSGTIGRLVEASKELAHLKPGQLVFLNPYHQTENGSLEVLNGVNSAGSFAGLVRVPGSNVHILNEKKLVGERGYDLDELGYLGWMASVHSGLANIHVTKDEIVLIAPVNGILGYAAINMALVMKAKVIALWSEEVDSGTGKGKGPETNGFPRTVGPSMLQQVEAGNLLVRRIKADTKENMAMIRAMAEQLGAENGTVDNFVDLSGFGTHTGSHFEAGVLSVRQSGCVSLMGAVNGVARFPYQEFEPTGLRVTGSTVPSRKQINLLIQYIENGDVKIGKLAGTECAGVFQLSEYETAFRVAAQGIRMGRYTLMAPNGCEVEDTPVKGSTLSKRRGG